MREMPLYKKSVLTAQSRRLQAGLTEKPVCEKSLLEYGEELIKKFIKDCGQGVDVIRAYATNIGWI